tara:strand:+ start:1503 stop:2291 length:789 start_codon:yes stop_codon:yes gene_type:complete
MAGNVKEEHYKIVYDTGGTIKSKGDKQENERNNALRKPTPASVYHQGGEVEDENKKMPTEEPMQGISMYEKGGEVDEKEDRHPHIMESQRKSRELMVNRIKTMLEMIKGERDDLRKNYLSSKESGDDITEIVKEIRRNNLKHKYYNDLMQYYDVREANPFPDTGLLDEARDIEEGFAKSVAGDTPEVRTPQKEQPKPVEPKAPKAVQSDKEDEEVDKKRLGGKIGYSYKNQRYQKPKGDNYASSNRASQGERFSDDVIGMGE